MPPATSAKPLVPPAEPPPPSVAEEDRSRVPQSPGAADLGALLREDLRTYEGDWSAPGFLAVATHRVGSRAAQVGGLGGALLSGAHRVAATAVDWIWGIDIPLRVKLGRRVRIWHHGGVLLNARAIGDDVHLRHNTTLGPARGAEIDDPTRLPTIEDGADLGCGACVMGPVRVGRGAVVGANTVVLKDVPDGATMLGVPGRVIPT